MNFYIKYENNYYALDGLSLTEVFLERILFVEGEVEYTEDYRSVGVLFVLKWLFMQLSSAYHKELKREKV